MYVNDPHDLALEPRLEGWDQEEEEDDGKPDYAAIFFSEYRPSGSSTQYHNHFAVGVCRFDSEGNHVSMAKNCPHFERADEEGPRIRAGWTVQQGKRN